MPARLQFRNFTATGELYGDAWGAVDSFPITPCELCPNATYKAAGGDDVALCRACPWRTSVGIANRTSCACYRVAGGATGFTSLFFNTTTGECEGRQETHYAPPPELSLDGTVLTRWQQARCEPGFYCVGGVRRVAMGVQGRLGMRVFEGVRYPCPAGRYGNRQGETSPQCSGSCDPGFYCPPASATSTAEPCGSTDRYCPAGSAAPVAVAAGYFTVEDATAAVRSAQAVCPRGHWCPGDGLRHACAPGRHGGALGLSAAACAGACQAGYTCAAASVNATARPCGGTAVYCSEGSAVPTPALDGYYTISAGMQQALVEATDPLNTTRTAQILCGPGYYCTGGAKIAAARSAVDLMRAEPARIKCPPGTYQWRYGAHDVSDCAPCPAGYFCPSYPAPPTVDPAPFECGGPDVYCPEGSSEPLPVKRRAVSQVPEMLHGCGVGYYSTGVAREGLDDGGATRSAQARCEPGYYCRGGIRTECPAGTYGATTGLNTPRCSGWCPAGHACPRGSAQPSACAAGRYAPQGSPDCYDCPLDARPPPPPPLAAPRCRTSRLCCYGAAAA
ncbi:hypothetical protein JKP88DRAFT_276023 [Tribonema minus]|uniref:TNFR-Cys domain-containing protein n=1 Tax=Tribonema minus TaxID=303371 RepID=A0A835Z6D3_9STRA|nr:hypothetical protein JKP88DRAFT_276023 [Tribonema minus]